MKGSSKGGQRAVKGRSKGGPRVVKGWPKGGQRVVRLRSGQRAVQECLKSASRVVKEEWLKSSQRAVEECLKSESRAVKEWSKGGSRHGPHLTTHPTTRTRAASRENGLINSSQTGTKKYQTVVKQWSNARRPGAFPMGSRGVGRTGPAAVARRANGPNAVKRRSNGGSERGHTAFNRQVSRQVKRRSNCGRAAPPCGTASCGNLSRLHGRGRGRAAPPPPPTGTGDARGPHAGQGVVKSW